MTSSHAIPAIIRKFHEAFLHVDDLADACLFLKEHYYGDDRFNVGTGEDLSIRELSETIRHIVAPGVAITFGATKPDGTPRKLLDVRRLHDLGWRHQIAPGAGIASTCDWFCADMLRRPTSNLRGRIRLVQHPVTSVYACSPSHR